MPQISPLALIEKTAEIADDVRIGPFSYIGPSVHIGPGCVIENNVTIVGQTSLGAKNHVFPLAVIGLTENAKGEGSVALGEANSIREHVTIYGGADSPTQIGTDNLIMIGSQVGGGAIIGDHGIFANISQFGPGCKIEDYVRTSAFTMIEPGVTVGAYTFVAGFAEVRRDVPPFAMMQGSPLRVRGVNTQNLSRCGFGENDIRELKTVFRSLFNGGGEDPDPKIVKKLQNKAGLNPHVRRLVDSLLAAKAAGDAADD